MSFRTEDLSGRVFGRLTVIQREKVGKNWKFKCICECGDETYVIGGHLLNGDTKSCGCLQRELFAQRRTSHGKSESPEYNSWRAMKERCNNPKNSHYDIYGGRGISYPEKWEMFDGFYEDMGERPEGMTLDRIDVNGNYCKENCRWATVTEQNINGGVRKDNKTGVRGVTIKPNGKFRVSFKRKDLGTYETLEEAAKVRKLAENDWNCGKWDSSVETYHYTRMIDSIEASVTSQ